MGGGGEGATVVVLRSKWARIRTSSCLLVGALLASENARDRIPSTALSIGVRVAVALVACGAIMRAMRSRLIVDESGITSANVGSTRSWPWPGVGSVGWDRSRLFGIAIAVSVPGDPRKRLASRPA